MQTVIYVQDLFLIIWVLCVCVSAMPSVMERSGGGVLSRSRAKNITNGNSQPHSEEESSDEEHAHGMQVYTRMRKQ